MFTPSPHQQAVFDFMSDGSGNAVIDAVAGSGKTTTILQGITRIEETQSILYLAFNKPIVQEMSPKLAMFENAVVKTVHSIGCAALRQAYRSKVEPDKYKAFVNRSMKKGAIKPSADLDTDQMRSYKRNIHKLVDLIRVDLCRSYDRARAIADRHGIQILDNELAVVSRVIQWGRQNVSEIDFTDMVYLPVMKDIPMLQYDWVFIDECQDLNAAQRALFLKCVKPSGRFVAVGDPHQAIYGFAGADVASFNKLKSIENTTTLPLSVCYRCGTKIIERAKRLVPHIEAFEGSKEGEILMDVKLSEVRDGDLVVCRVLMPLVQLCMKYLAEGTKAYIKGGQVGKDLVTLVKQTKKSATSEVFKVLDKGLAKIAADTSDRLDCSILEAQDSNVYQTRKDQIEALRALAEGTEEASEIIQTIDRIFTDTDQVGIMLSSIHKSKGLESDRLFILMPDKLYNPWAMKIPESAIQEANLEYVAITRAKSTLGYINKI